MSAPNTDEIYSDRDKLLSQLARMAFEQGYTVGLGIDESVPDIWQHVIFIELPTGQVSWHLLEDELEWFTFLPDYNDVWDGHSKIEKYNRILKYAKNYRHYHRKTSND